MSTSDLSIHRLASVRCDHTAANAPLDVRMAAHLRRLRDAIEGTDPKVLAESDLLPEGLKTLKHACDTILGWHERIESTIGVTARLVDGVLVLAARHADGSKAEFELE